MKEVCKKLTTTSSCRASFDNHLHLEMFPSEICLNVVLQITTVLQGLFHTVIYFVTISCQPLVLSGPVILFMSNAHFALCGVLLSPPPQQLNDENQWTQRIVNIIVDIFVLTKI